MPAWREQFLNLLLSTEDYLDALKRRVGHAMGMDGRLQITPYHGYGVHDRVWLCGRVLEDKEITPSAANDSLWSHLVAMYKRMESDEAPGVRVRIEVDDQEAVVTTNEEGYYSIQLPLATPLQTTGWISIRYILLDAPSGQQQTRFDGVALIPGADCQFGVISDIDDTIVVTRATSLLQMARLTLLNNARQRLPFAGAPGFYRALHRGSGSHAANPIFYLSSSPYNLYDLLVDFMGIHGFPAGPLLLRDFGLDRSLFRTLDHTSHKGAHIDELLKRYPHLPFLLIGDSGQQDAEIYAHAVQRWPGRICAIYIRDVTGAKRDAQVQRLIEQVRAQGVEMLLVADTAAAAQHAQRKGWIKLTPVG